jgi:hypothetical protein
MAIVFGYVAGTGSRWVEAYDTGTPMITPALQIATGTTFLQSGPVSSPPIFLPFFLLVLFVLRVFFVILFIRRIDSQHVYMRLCLCNFRWWLDRRGSIYTK